MTTNPKAGQPDMVEVIEVVAWAYHGPRGGLIAVESKPAHAPEAEALVSLSAFKALQSQLEAAERERKRALHDNEMLTTGGIIEVAVRNPSVADYMRHWENRAETAERERGAMREALEPFASLGDYILAEAPADANNIVLFTDCDGKVHSLMLEAFRDARKALQTQGDK